MTTPTVPMSATPPDVLLFVAPGCPHCASVLQGLNLLAGQKLIGKLTVIDVAEHPGQAAEYGVRSAPWLRLGPFTLTGAHSPAELSYGPNGRMAMKAPRTMLNIC
jgi:glutaredoxin